VIRAIRRRHGWRQEDLAQTAKVDQAYVSLAERGHLTRVPLPALRRICAALEIELSFTPRWRGPELARLIDSEHARLVEYVAAEMVAAGWQVIPEYTFNHFGERGSVDLVGWQPDHRALALTEEKTGIIDQQDLLSSNGRKLRIVPTILARERGWEPASIGNLLVVVATTRNREAIGRHPVTFGAAFPERTVAVQAWLKRPDRDLSGVWFVRPMILVHAKYGSGGSERVRIRRVRPDPV
jgi:transcriptional regulator with XRE-family HTH domain